MFEQIETTAAVAYLTVEANEQKAVLVSISRYDLNDSNKFYQLQCRIETLLENELEFSVKFFDK